MNQIKKRIGIDVTSLVLARQITGIERVATEINKSLIELLDPEVYEIEPFVTFPGLEKPKVIHPTLTFDPIYSKPLRSIDEFDILFFGCININLPLQQLLKLKSENGVKIVTLIHDILPITHPEWFPGLESNSGEGVRLSPKSAFQIYIQSSFSLANHLVLTSQHVLDDINKYKWNRIPEFTVIPLGAFEIPAPREKILHSGINTMYLSTVTIRKGHDDLLSAFDILWSKGIDINLTIVGNKGWRIDGFIERLLGHQQLNKKLFWKERLLDSDVAELYQKSDIAFIASEDEGFGLVLEEGLANQVKVIARDIDVFRERNYPNLYFFSGGPEGLSQKIIEVASLNFEKIPDGAIRTLKDFTSGLADIFRLI